MPKNFKIFFLFIGLSGGIYLLIHNISNYPVNLGYTFGFHASYLDVLMSDWRLPDLSETAVAYNPPLFYLTSGLFIKLLSLFTGQNLPSLIKYWPYVGAFLSIIALYLFSQIIKKLHPKDKLINLVSIIWVFSLPVFQKMIPMYTIEPFLLFTITLTIWYFISVFQPKPTIKKTLILSILTSINILTRLTSLVLLITLSLGILGLGLIKQLSYKKAISLLAVFLTLTAITSGWFYYQRRNQKLVYMSGVPKEKWPISKYGLSFYTDIPFKFMMTYPLRLPPPNPTPIIPVYYSSFWGDYWNYYIPSRFNISPEALKQDRHIVNSKRLKSLSLQNQINLLPTLIIMAGFFYQLFLSLKKLTQKPDHLWLSQTMFLGLSFLTWFGFIYFVSFYPSWKGDNIKAGYMLYNLPIFIYFATQFLLVKLKKYKIIFIPTIIWLSLATLVNLWWSWY